MTRSRRSGVTQHGGNPTAPRNLPLADAGGAGNPVPPCDYCQAPVRKKRIPGQTICPDCADHYIVRRAAEAFLSEQGLRPLDDRLGGDSPEEVRHRREAAKAKTELLHAVRGPLANPSVTADGADDGPLARIQAKRAEQARESAARVDAEQQELLEKQVKRQAVVRRKASDKNRREAAQRCANLEKLIAAEVFKGADDTPARLAHLAALRKSLAAAQQGR